MTKPTTQSINHPPLNHSKLSHIYCHFCNNCKISYESGIENEFCPNCKKIPIKSDLIAIRDYAPRSFRQTIARKIRKYLP